MSIALVLQVRGWFIDLQFWCSKPHLHSLKSRHCCCAINLAVNLCAANSHGQQYDHPIMCCTCVDWGINIGHGSRKYSFFKLMSLDFCIIQEPLFQRNIWASTPLVLLWTVIDYWTLGHICQYLILCKQESHCRELGSLVNIVWMRVNFEMILASPWVHIWFLITISYALSTINFEFL